MTALLAQRVPAWSATLAEKWLCPARNGLAAHALEGPTKRHLQYFISRRGKEKKGEMGSIKRETMKDDGSMMHERDTHAKLKRRSATHKKILYK